MSDPIQTVQEPQAVKEYPKVKISDDPTVVGIGRPESTQSGGTKWRVGIRQANGIGLHFIVSKTKTNVLVFRID